jgi:bifunctional non-homologous end joining protein LigD
VADPLPMDLLPRDVRPMKATAGDLPADDEGWAYEIKWDGMRLLAHAGADGGGLELVTANGRSATDRFPELVGLAEAIGTAAVLDGEVVVLDDRGRSDFGRLQRRMHASGSAARDLAATDPVQFLVFDVLSVGATSTIHLPYHDRRHLLEGLVDEGPYWRVPGRHLGEGRALYDQAVRQGLEGLMAKRIDSTYRPGTRSRDWRKIKIRPHQEFVVGGWLDGKGARAGGLGSLLVGCHEPDGLAYVGRVGTGFSDVERDRLGSRLEARARADTPFAVRLPGALSRQAHHVEPTMVVEVAFAEWTAEGRLRHPSYLGERTDVDPTAVVREPHPADPPS